MEADADAQNSTAIGADRREHNPATILASLLPEPSPLRGGPRDRHLFSWDVTGGAIGVSDDPGQAIAAATEALKAAGEGATGRCQEVMLMSGEYEPIGPIARGDGLP
ncbi:hypothetical protein GCM10027589_11070 [Actinocorallia lasiicapitis]